MVVARGRPGQRIRTHAMVKMMMMMMTVLMMMMVMMVMLIMMTINWGLRLTINLSLATSGSMIAACDRGLRSGPAIGTMIGDPIVGIPSWM